MNTIYKLRTVRAKTLIFGALLLALEASSAAYAQQSSVGFFSVVNAVGLPTNTTLTIDGKILRKDGLKPGEASGGLGLTAGPHTIGVANSDCKAGTLVLKVNPEASPILIVYLVNNGFQDGKPLRELRIATRENRPGKASFSAIYAGVAGSLPVQFNGQPQTLAALKEVNIAGDNTRSVTVSASGKDIAKFTPEEAGNYLIVLFQMPDAHIEASIVRDVVRHVAG